MFEKSEEIWRKNLWNCGNVLRKFRMDLVKIKKKIWKNYKKMEEIYTNIL